LREIASPLRRRDRVGQGADRRLGAGQRRGEPMQPSISAASGLALALRG
jgi:hypothetical protein